MGLVGRRMESSKDHLRQEEREMHRMLHGRALKSVRNSTLSILAQIESVDGVQVAVIKLCMILQRPGLRLHLRSEPWFEGRTALAQELFFFFNVIF